MVDPLRCADYTVAWISPLPLEMTAAKLLIDGKPQPLPEDLEFDHNSYAFGSEYMWP
ncbi:hypothetical protein TWF730_011181 [Orbilia blumenaviensis]|uniref:Uncharacterized protein n=1 Tax=Orbilia blumenaviensis TaxID=1796055 RepID=A0AAV9ULX6_9PEZI